ncbi:MAG: hypothetical protein ABFD50_07160 [Smithella sp.]
MDISKYNLAKAAENGFEFEITHPDTGEGLDGFIKVRGERSKEVVAYQRKKLNQQFKEEAVANRKGNKDTKVMLVEDYLENANESAAMRVISWRKIQKDGVDIPFSVEAAIALFEEYDWIRAQVLEVSNASENFCS